MKKLIFLVLVFAGFMACENESIQELPQETSVTEDMNARMGDKIDVCHYDAENDSWHVINISANAWEGHEKHGDVRLDDVDGDGFVPDNECGYGNMGDCNDEDPSINPGAEDIPCDGIDQNCDGLDAEFENQDWYLVSDEDGDGYWIEIIDVVSGTCPPEGYISEDEAILFRGDCDDTNPDVNPGAPEICDNIDNNCDGLLADRIGASASYAGQTFNSGIAFFGTAGTISGSFVHYEGLTAGCDPILDDLSGKIALIERGGCFFNQKALNAQNAGAIGVIICFREGENLFNMAAGLPDEITIPVISLGFSDCQTIISGGGTVSISVEDTCFDSGERVATNSKSKTSKSPKGFNTIEKVTQ